MTWPPGCGVEGEGREGVIDVRIPGCLGAEVTLMGRYGRQGEGGGEGHCSHKVNLLVISFCKS